MLEADGRISHIPVLSREILDLLSGRHIEYFLDGTVGAGGHADLILEAHPELCLYTALDQDPTALRIAAERLKKYEQRVALCHTNFSSLPDHLPALFDAILIDIGVSSMQIDTAERGFSFMKDGPLDMRMDQSNETLSTAEDIVNGLPQKELADLFFHYGEETRSHMMAKAICDRRKKKRFTTTADLAEFIVTLISHRGAAHPATKVFQALRIAVNRELEVLEKALETLPWRLKPHGGRFFVITFHSLEDRIVKNFFQKFARMGERDEFSLVTKKPLSPDYTEVRANRRARSAKLRVLERS